MEDSATQLIRIMNRERKDLKEEINYLRNLLWELTASDCDHDGPHVFDTSPDQNSYPIPEPEPERGEEVGKSIWDAMCRDIIGDLFTL